MAAKQAEKQATATAAAASDGQGASQTESSAQASARTPRARKVARRVRKKAARRRVAPKKPAARKVARRGRVARKVARRRYSDAERRNILETARREGLTGKQIAARFGITQVTYYLWRKKSGESRPRLQRAEAAAATVGKTIAGAMNLADLIRLEIRKRIGQLVPEILSSEIQGSMGGGSVRRRRRRRA